MSEQKNTRVWECTELTFAAEMEHAAPYLGVELQAEFSGPEGRRLLVPGFWDGCGSWKVRFAPTAPGEWRWTSICSETADRGLHGRSGIVDAAGWSEGELADNPNRRGFIRVHESGRYFEYADGTPFYWLGDTLWAAHTLRCDPEESLPRYLRDRKDKGFTVIQLTAGHPTADLNDDDSSGYAGYSPANYANEGGAPFARRYDAINPDYFRHLDRRIRLMADMGFVPCILGMWGQELKAIKVPAAAAYLKYIVARYAAYNVTWSPTGEYLFTWDVEGWRELGETIDRHDPYGHPTSVHSIAPHSGSMHYHVEDWYDFNLIQVGHVLAFKNFMEQLPYADYRLQPAKPAIMSESWYENHPNRVFDDGTWIGDKDIRFAAYVSLLQGCVGQTYGTHGIWSFFDGKEAGRWRDDERPSLWTDDLELPGSTQMKHLRALMESLPWWELEPHPEWVTTVVDSNVYCAAVHRKLYVVYTTGGRAPVPVMVMVVGAKDEAYEGQWFNPRTGERSEARGEYHGYGAGKMWRAFTPDGEDWVLTLRRAAENSVG